MENPGLREGWFKISCSRRTGGVRANELNLDASTGTPGSFRCVFEYRTQDCGKAEERVFQKLAEHRRGKWGQEFFEVGLDHAKESITQVCSDVDQEIVEHAQQIALSAPPPPITTMLSASLTKDTTSGVTIADLTEAMLEFVRKNYKGFFWVFFFIWILGGEHRILRTVYGILLVIVLLAVVYLKAVLGLLITEEKKRWLQ